MNILSELKEQVNNYNLGAMNDLVERLSAAELEEYKQDIIDAYGTLYSYGLYDLDCDKVDEPIDFIYFLLDIIASIQRFYPDEMYYQERGYLHEDLAARADSHEDKLRYIQEAIRIYDIAPQTTDIQMAMVRALTDRMEITEQFTTAGFAELLTYYRPVLNDTAFVKSLIHYLFRVRSLSFAHSHDWHQKLLREFEGAMHAHAEKDLLVYLDWAETYHYILYHNTHTPTIDAAYAAGMVAHTALLLQPLEGYYTESHEMLNRLGKAFADTGKRSTNQELQLEYYRTSIDFFTKGQELQPAAWTFPVYATNSLLGMAGIYHERGDYGQLINCFEHGLQLFSQVYEHEEDFTLNLYWGDFLLAYTGLAYDYRSPSINRLAEEKLQIAVTLGENYYSHPYFSLARLAIKSGNKEKCVDVLLQCREAIRSTGYNAYDLTDAINDEDFREIRDQLM